MSSRKWVCACLLLVAAGLLATGVFVFIIDPFFHYHAPYVSSFWYVLDNERSQNDGILRHFEYDSVIIGTSMTENFKTSEAQSAFGGQWVKVPFPGATYKEINQYVALALKVKGRLANVIRCIDLDRIFNGRDAMREDMGVYPEYLYNENPLDDVKYLLNRSVLFERCLPTVATCRWQSGITSFDKYAFWSDDFEYGPVRVIGNRSPEVGISARVQLGLSAEERKELRAVIRQNVVSMIESNPETPFMLFFPPYSAVFWYDALRDGSYGKRLEAERLLIETLVGVPNVRLFAFDDFQDLVSDFNHYRDAEHYGAWVNSQLLVWMHEGVGLLTRENYGRYLSNKDQMYRTMDWKRLFEQDEDLTGGPDRIRASFDGIRRCWLRRIRAE